MAPGIYRKSFASPDIHGFDQTRLRRLKQLRNDGEVMTSGFGDVECHAQINAEHMAGCGQPQLPEAGLQDVPGLVLFVRNQGVLASGTLLAAVRFTVPWSGAVPRLGAGFAVSRPSARLEVPAAESPDAFFAAVSSTCLRVNS